MGPLGARLVWHCSQQDGWAVSGSAAGPVAPWSLAAAGQSGKREEELMSQPCLLKAAPGSTLQKAFLILRAPCREESRALRTWKRSVVWEMVCTGLQPILC